VAELVKHLSLACEMTRESEQKVGICQSGLGPQNPPIVFRRAEFRRPVIDCGVLQIGQTATSSPISSPHPLHRPPISRPFRANTVAGLGVGSSCDRSIAIRSASSAAVIPQ